MASINLPTATKQDAIQTKVDGIDTKATSIKTTAESTDAKATTINTNLGVPASAASAATSANAHAKLNYLLANSQVVKSVQRGIATINSDVAVSVTVNTVNMQKSMLNINTGTNANFLVTNVYGYLKTSTAIELKRNDNSTANITTVAWELIEFY